MHNTKLSTDLAAPLLRTDREGRMALTLYGHDSSQLGTNPNHLPGLKWGLDTAL